MGKEIDKAILKVAYILTSLSGVEKAENKKVFKEITHGFSWFRPGDPETDKFVLNIIETTKELATMRQLYDENEYYAAFLSKIMQECETIKNDSKVMGRKAFVIWIAICLADNDGLSEIEEKTLKNLQDCLNSNRKEKLEFGFSGFIRSPGIIAPPGWSPSREKIKITTVPDEYITENFMNKVLDTIALLSELKAQIDATSDEEQKNSLQVSFDIMQAQLNSLIIDD